MLPFASPYRTVAIGLGALAVDLGGAVLITSLVRQRLGYRGWRIVHWLAYLAWPVAFVHSITAGNDLRIWWVALVEEGCALAVATAMVARLLFWWRGPDPAAEPARAGTSGRKGCSGEEKRRPLLLRRPAACGPVARHAPALAAGGRRRRPGQPGRASVQIRAAARWPWPTAAGVADRGDRPGRAYRPGRRGYPTARKLAAVAAGHAPVVLANGTEGEPASAKDKALMARSPQLVLDGAVLAAEMVGARETVIVVHPAARRVIDDAAAERTRAGFDRVRITVRTAAERFVAGEASAVVHWIERGVPAPTASPPRVSERGLRGAPTLVQNVETLAHLALIARYGAAWFRSVGTSAEPGSMLVTVLGAVREPACSRSLSAHPSGGRSTWPAARRRRCRRCCSAGTSATG